MASIRLFGRGRNAAAAASGPAVGAALIADVLESLTAASMSTTWRCRHSGGVSIGEGAVDFTASRSRSTVIRGKYTFEYVRSGASAYRTAVVDVDPSASAKAAAGSGAGADVGAEEAEDEDLVASEAELEFEDDEEEDGEGFDDGEDGDDVEIDEALDGEEDEAKGDDEEDAEDADGEIDAEAEDGEDEDGDEEGDEDDEDDASEEPASSVTTSASLDPSPWERFSEHDACGVHAYAEPAVLAAGVRSTGVVLAREAQEFDGVMLSAYAVTLKPKPGDPNRVLARLARQLRDHGANVVVVTAFVDESRSDVEELDEVGASNGDGSESAESAGEGAARIVRLRIELPHWTPADDPTADHSVSVDLFEFDEPVSVEVPEGAGRRTARSCADLALF